MARANPFAGLTSAAKGFGQLPMVRQLGLLVGLSASIALGFAVVLWSKEPNYRPVYSHLTPQEMSDVLDGLQETGVDFKIDHRNGTILVPQDQVYDARFKVASTGVLNGTGIGFESLSKESGIGLSRFMETARYRHAIEEELARTISSLANIKNARVHLAIPKDSVFVNDESKAQASVLVDLMPGRTLDHQQVSAIVHLVSASVPNLSTENVSVVDGVGKLLTGDGVSSQLAQSKEHFDYTNHVEHEYAQRIENLLTPLLGKNSVRAKVSADIDFTRMEETAERYLPESRVLRSEQMLSESLNKNASPVGVPGALTNQPPATALEQPANQPPAANAANPAPAANQATTSANGNTRQQATRNYELGKTVSHSQLPTGQIKRLSVAVVVDNHKAINAETGDVTSTPLTPDEIKQITNLVENVVGFNTLRGDRISVVNIPFAKPDTIEEAPAIPLWKQAWVWDGAKILAAGLFLLLMVFRVLKPALRSLASVSSDHPMHSAANPVLAAPAGGNFSGDMVLANQASSSDALSQDRLTLTQQQQLPALSTEDRWEAVRQMANNDPKRIAQVMRNWVGDNH